jgi:hypothetical protein
MALQVLSDKQTTNRTSRFAPEFITSLKELITGIVLEIQQRTKSGLNLARDLNKSLSIFIRNLFSILDRGIAFQLVC